jgi:hypothetical protein
VNLHESAKGQVGEDVDERRAALVGDPCLGARRAGPRRGTCEGRARRGRLHPRRHAPVQEDGQAVAYPANASGHNPAAQLFVVRDPDRLAVSREERRGSQRRFFSRRSNARWTLRG